MAAKDLPDAAYLRECFDYDPETGVLTWKRRPREHFENDHFWRIFLSSFVAKPAGSRSGRYVRVIFTGPDRRHYTYAHRIIWKMRTGDDPPVQVDHKNHDKRDNRWSNLRLATHQDNMRNRNGWGGRDLPKGVSRHHRRYVAHGTIDYRNVYIGIFDTPEKAHAAYCEFVAEHHGQFFSPGGETNANDSKRP